MADQQQDQDPFANYKDMLRNLAAGPPGTAMASQPPSPPVSTAPDATQMPAWRLQDPRGMTPYIRDTATKYGIDPDTAVRVAQSEGLSTFYGDQGKSGGAFQLYTGGGYGNEFQKETGLDPLDPKNEQATIDYALRRASQDGWSAFHGAANVGIDQWEGIKTAAQVPATGQAPKEEGDPFANYKEMLQQLKGGQPDQAGTSPGFIGGLKAGLTDIRQAGLAIHALGDKLMGDENGMRDLMGTYQTLEQAKASQTKFKSIQDLYDHGSVGDVLNYVLYNLGEQVPSIAVMAAGGGLGGFIGKRLGVMAAEGLVDSTAADALISKFGSRASLVGAYTAATLGQTIPAITGEQYQATGDIQPGIGIGMGALAGVPAVATPLALGARFALPESLATVFPEAIRSAVAAKLGDSWLARRASGALVYGFEAGAGAGLQQAVQDAARSFVDQNFQFLGPESRSRILNAAANGTLLGSIFGTVTRAHAHDDYIANKWMGALGLDTTGIPPGTPSRVTPVTDPVIDKALPFGDNPSYNVVQQVFREKLVESGGWDKLNPRQQQFLIDNPHTLESMELVMPMVRQELIRDIKSREITADDGTTKFKPDSVDPDFQTQTIAVRGLHDTEVRTMPMADAPLREAAIRAIDTMDGKDGRPIPFFKLIPEGYAHTKFADIDVGQVHHPISPAYWDMFKGYSTTDSAGKQVDLSNGLPKDKVIFLQNVGDKSGAPPGTPKPIFDTKQMRVLEGVIKRYAKGAKVLVSTKELDNPIGGLHGTSFFRSLGDGNYIIHLQQDQLLHATYYHEIGHLVAWHHFAESSLAQKLVLYTAYRNELRDFSGNDLMDLAARASKPGSLRLYKEFGGVDATNFRNWFDFDEWMAEGFARAMVDQHEKLTDRYFDGVVSKAKGALKDLGVDLDTLKPHQFLGDYFDSLYKQPPVGMDMIASDVLKSSAENARATGTKLNPGDSFADTIAKSPPSAPQNEGMNEAVARGLLTRAHRAQADKFSWFTRWMWNTMQVAILNPHIEPLNRASNLFQAFHADRMGTMIGADGILKAHRKLGKAMGQVLNNVLFAMDRRDYQRPDEPPRMPTRDEFKQLVRDAGGDTASWQKIGPVFEQYQATFRGIIDRMEASLMAEAQKITDPDARAMRINNVSYEMSAMRTRPYFPHSRYGDYAVLIRDADGKKLHFEMFHTQRLATTAGKELAARYGNDHPGADYQLSKIPNELRQWFGLPPQMLDRIREMPGITPEQHDWIDNFRFEMSPENSFSKHFMRRTGIAGYDMNAQRSFANYMSAASGHMARLKYRGQIDDAVKDLFASAKAMDPHDLAANAKRTEMAEWLQREADYVMHPPNEFAAGRAIAFQWYLGFNPSTAFVHLMQMPMFTAPYMSKIYGMGSVMRMLSSYRDMGLGLTDPTKLNLGTDFTRNMQRAFHDGFMSENRGVDMASWAQHNLMNRALSGTNIQRNIMSVLNATGNIMRTVEKSNRLVTFRAAWKEALADPGNRFIQQLVDRNRDLFNRLLGEGESPQTAAAYIAARDAVQQTHFSYTQVARPRWQRGILNPATTFMMYKQQALWFFFHNPAGMRSLAMLTAVSGVTGLPFEQDASNIVKWISEHFFGSRWDPNEELQKHLAELTDHPETFMHGFGSSGLGMPALFSQLGIPIQLGDVSRRLGYGELLPGVSEWTRDQQESFMERFGNATAATLGATLEIPITAGQTLSNLNIPYAMQRLLEGGVNWETLRGLEPMMPALLRNIEQASRYVAQGGDVSAMGGMKTPLDFNDAEGWTAVMSRAFGFTPEDIARTGRVDDTMAQIGNYWKVRKATLMQQFVQARMMKDEQAMADTVEAVKRFNTEAPSAKMKIKAQGLIASLKRQAEKNMLQAQGRSMDPGLSQSVLPSYPEYQQQLAVQNTGSPPFPQQ